MMKQIVNIKFVHREEFDKDLKILLKKYRSLTDDIETIKGVLKVRPNEAPPFSFRIDHIKLETCVIKIKKIACKSLKGKGVQSGLRLVYAYLEQEQRIELIELYHKSDKEIEDRNRIKKYYK